MNNSIEYETITRCDGITYTRKKRNNNFDGHVNIKFHKDKIEQLKKSAQLEKTNYNQLLRNLIYDYIDKYK